MRTRLRRALTDAISSRDLVAVAALRSALSAIDNAEAVAVTLPAAGQQRSSQEATSGGHAAGSRVGLGAGEVARKELTAADVDAVVKAQIEEWLAAATEYDELGRSDVARRLRAEAGVLVRFAHPSG